MRIISESFKVSHICYISSSRERKREPWWQSHWFPWCRLRIWFSFLQSYPRPVYWKCSSRWKLESMNLNWEFPDWWLIQKYTAMQNGLMMGLDLMSKWDRGGWKSAWRAMTRTRKRGDGEKGKWFIFPMSLEEHDESRMNHWHSGERNCPTGENFKLSLRHLLTYILYHN